MKTDSSAKKTWSAQHKAPAEGSAIVRHEVTTHGTEQLECVQKGAARL